MISVNIYFGLIIIIIIIRDLYSANSMEPMLKSTEQSNFKITIKFKNLKTLCIAVKIFNVIKKLYHISSRMQF
jgi:hypothetical protein